MKCPARPAQKRTNVRLCENRKERKQNGRKRVCEKADGGTEPKSLKLIEKNGDFETDLVLIYAKRERKSDIIFESAKNIDGDGVSVGRCAKHWQIAKWKRRFGIICSRAKVR